MQITAISSINLFARDNALNASYLRLMRHLEKEGTKEQCLALSLLAVEPPEDAPVGPDPDFPELGDNPSRIFFKVSIHSNDGETHETICVLSDCISCATNAVLPDLLEKVEAEHLVIALPVGVSLGGTIDLLAEQDADEYVLESAQYAVLTDNFEADLWSDESLSRLGVTGSTLDERKPGEFMVKELALADTLVTGHMPFDRISSHTTRRVQELVLHLAPHLKVIESNAVADHDEICGCHVLENAQRRSSPGYLEHPKHFLGENFSTVVLSTEALVDAKKFGKKLKEIVQDACRVRGYCWMTGYETEMIAIEGAGPQTWLQSKGEWNDTAPETLIAITGQNLDHHKLQKILDSCLVSGNQIVENLLKTAG